MICQNCGEREAVLLALTIVQNQVSKIALCARCAGQTAPSETIDDFMAALAELSTRARVHPGRCPTCRQSLADFKESGRFGCPQCYDHFAAQIRDLLPRVHGGAYQHRGKTPGRR